MHAFILAGGFATRLWPLTEKRAKPLLPLAGKPILTHLVERIPAGIPVTVSTNAAFEEGFREWAAQIGRNDILIAVEETRNDSDKLGALGATAQWIQKEHIEEDLLLLTGDNYLGFSLEKFLEHTKPDTALLAVYDIGDRERAKAFGTVIVSPNNGESRVHRIEAFEEKPQNPKSTLISTGCSFLPRATLPVLLSYAEKHPDNVGGIFEELLRTGHSVESFTFTEPWFDIGSFEAYLEATKLLVGSHVLRGENTVTEDSDLQGSIVIGRNSSVRKSTLQDTVLGENCTLIDCVLTECILDNNCHLEGIDLTGKMLREGTILKR